MQAVAHSEKERDWGPVWIPFAISFAENFRGLCTWLLLCKVHCIYTCQVIFASSMQRKYGHSYIICVCMHACTWFPRWCCGEESTRQCRRCRRHGFDPWVRKRSWIRKWQPTPVLLHGKFHEQRNLVGYSPRGHKELDRTEHAPPHMYVCMDGDIAHSSLNATCAHINFWSVTSQKKTNHLFQGFITSQNLSWKRRTVFSKMYYV